MKTVTGFLTTIMIATFAILSNADAAVRPATTRATSTVRRAATTVSQSETSTPSTNTAQETDLVQSQTTKPAPIIQNKSAQFDNLVETISQSASDDNFFAMEIRRQRAALETAEASTAIKTAQQSALANTSSGCDTQLRKCMAEKCGDDFTQCATDGDTIFNEKLNACKRAGQCGAHEYNLFAAEIKSDRDMNVRLASYNDVINCGNQYNACIMNECGTTYSKCLGLANEQAAIKKCETIARECGQSDSGLASRFGRAIALLRERAETNVAADEKRLYELRDLMRGTCEKLGAKFDERSFDCVYTINFFAGENQSSPLASRRAYAGDTFVCTQEWFGINATTYRENAYRETRAQTGASSAMLGSGVGTAVGTITSGAINRAIDTQKAKTELDKERVSQGLPTLDAEKRASDQALRDAKKAEREQRQNKNNNNSGEQK